jgi:hypothetical protein
MDSVAGEKALNRITCILFNNDGDNMSNNTEISMEWEGLVPGDIVEYNGQRYVYRGLNPNGGPGALYGQADPVFGPDHPTFPDQIWYLRAEASFPFGPLPNVMKESASSAKDLGAGTRIGFLYAERKSLKKVGHVEPKAWNNMIAELRRELQEDKHFV